MMIERGSASADEFLSGIERMTEQLVMKYGSQSVSSEFFAADKETVGNCPRCGSPVYVGKGNYYCSNKECSFCLWEDNKFFASKKKKLTRKIAEELLKNDSARLNGYYSEKTGKTYDAIVLLDDSGDKYVSFKIEFASEKNASMQ